MSRSKLKVIDELHSYSQDMGHHPTTYIAMQSFSIPFSAGENDFMIVFLQVRERIVAVVEIISHVSRLYDSVTFECIQAYFLRLNSQIHENRLDYGYSAERDAIIGKSGYVVSATDMDFNYFNYDRLREQVASRLTTLDLLLADIVQRCTESD